MQDKRKKMANKLQELLSGEVITDEKALRSYSFDQSIYQITPMAVVMPKSLEELVKVITFAFTENVPITARGGGSGTAGSALGSGIVIALKRGGILNQLSEVTQASDGIGVHVGSNVYHSVLQKHLISNGYFLPADPTSSKICKIGGNISTKASGPHALKYGSIADFMEHVDFITNKGEIVSTSDPASIPPRLQRGIKKIRKQICADIQSKAVLQHKKNMKTASGYNVFPMTSEIPDHKLLAQVMVGSVGTLGYITGATIRGIPYDPGRATMRLYFSSLSSAVQAVNVLRKHDIAAIELVNRETLKIVRGRSNSLADFKVEHDMLLVEFCGRDAADKLSDARKALLSEEPGLVKGVQIATDPAKIDKLWKVRKMILPVLSNPGNQLKALPVVNDVGVPPGVLPDFVDHLTKILNRHSLEAILYGHAGSGNLHLRPLFDIGKKGLKKQIATLADEVYDLVLSYGGTITAEHGMGRLRAPYLRQEWGDEIYGHMKRVKELFDPDDLFNPGVMFGEQAITKNMRKDIFGETP